MRSKDWLWFAAWASLSSGCAHSPPELGKHLSGTWEQASQVFNARLKDRFPVGSSDAALRAELEREGFSISGGRAPSGVRSVAKVDQPGFPCRLLWQVVWSAEEGSVTTIAGAYSGTCV